MTALETYNEKYLVCKSCDDKLNMLNNQLAHLNSEITINNNEVTQATTNKNNADSELTIAEGNIPGDMTTYQAKYDAVQKATKILDRLTIRQTRLSNELSRINGLITTATAEKTTADSDLATAQAAL